MSTRLNPEGAAPLVQVTRSSISKGMAGNVYNNLFNLGADVDCIYGNKHSLKKRYYDVKSNKLLLRVDNDEMSDPIEMTSIKNIDSYDAVVISDYNKGSISYDLIFEIVNAYNKPIFIDTKKNNLKDFKHAFVKVNEQENKFLTHGCDNLLITLGSSGVMCKPINQIVPSIVVDVVDVCGAGDTFLAAFAASYIVCEDVYRSAFFANMSASVTIGHLGVYAPSINDVKKMLENI